MPEIIGAHYFQWNDQHVAGRFDGENWQIGLVDICQRPYEEVAVGRAAEPRAYLRSSRRPRRSVQPAAARSWEIHTVLKGGLV